MELLVIDDNIHNRNAARAQLNDHEITVVGDYDEGQKLVQKKHGFEAVLVDLLMPASGQAQGDEGKRFVGQEMPIGIFLALLAAKNGAKYVSVFTDSNHHSHPASACFDAFNNNEILIPFKVENAKVLLCNNLLWIDNFSVDDFSKPLDRHFFGEVDPNIVQAKNWRALLDYLID